MSKSNVIRVSIGQNVTANGYYFDLKDKQQFMPNKKFENEQTMKSYFNDMQECGFDFQLVIERKA